MKRPDQHGHDQEGTPRAEHVLEEHGLELDRVLVGVEVELTSLQGKWKVSQNRSAADRAGVAAGLEALDSDAARAMAGLVRA